MVYEESCEEDEDNCAKKRKILPNHEYDNAKKEEEEDQVSYEQFLADPEAKEVPIIVAELEAYLGNQLSVSMPMDGVEAAMKMNEVTDFTISVIEVEGSYENQENEPKPTKRGRGRPKKSPNSKLRSKEERKVVKEKAKQDQDILIWSIRSICCSFMSYKIAPLWNAMRSCLFYKLPKVAPQLYLFLLTFSS